MSKIKLELCEQILKEYYGDHVTKVGVYLLRNTLSPLTAVSIHTQLEVKQVKKALVSLIQQNIVSFTQPKPGVITFKANADEVLWRLRYPHYIQCAKSLYGDAAELLVEELLVQGQSSLASAVQKTTDKLNESIATSGSAMPSIHPNLVRDKVVNLVKARLIRRCENVIKDDKDRAVGINKSADPNVLFTLPSVAEFEHQSGSKRGHEEGLDIGAKRIKLESGTFVQPSAPDGSQVTGASDFWCVNFHRFHHHFRDQAILTAVSRSIDERACEVMRIMLRLSETRTDPTHQESVPLSLTEINSAMTREKTMSKQTLDQYLKCLSENCANFVTKVGESSGGMYQINFFKAIKAICISQIETIVLERFGSKALRMFKVILDKKHMEQKQVEEQAMLPPKEAKELLYNMFAENYVTLTELSRTPDHAPARTIYLYTINLLQLARMLLENCYKATANIMIRRHKCISENKRLLDKQERVAAIIASLDAEGATDQKEEIEQMVTPTEKVQLKKVGDATKMLEQSEMQLDQTIFLLETFLNYSLNPPAPKK